MVAPAVRATPTGPAAQNPPAAQNAPAAPAAPVNPSAPAIVAGEPLTAALESLRRAGLALVYSDALVRPSLRVREAPGAGTPEQLARRILAPHGLALERTAAGPFTVIAGPLPVPASTVAPPDGPDASELQEVPVFASRWRVDPSAEASLTELTREQLEALPGLDEDVLRVMRYLPGTATNGVSARANVRGGRDDELAVYFDGAPLFEPFHFKDYQGLLGMLDPGAIARLDFYSGVFPVRWGDRLSGVLDVAPREAAGGNYHELGLSMLYAHGLSVGETAWRGRPLRWLGSLRQSTVEATIRAADREGLDPHFVDTLARVEFEPDARTRLVAGFLLLNDSLDAVLSSGEQRTDSRYRDGTGWLSARREGEGGLALSATLSGTERHTERRGALRRPGSVDGALADERELRASTLRLEARRVADAAPGWTVGLELQQLDASFDYAATAGFEPALARAFGRPSALARAVDLDAPGLAGALYGAVQLAPWPRWSLELGLRADAQRHEAREAARRERFRDLQWSPRLAARYDWSDRTVLRASLGRAWQSQRPDELQVADGEPGFHPAQRATQAVLSLERRLGPRALLRVEGYRKAIARPAPRYENLLDPVVLLPEIEPDRFRVAPDEALLYGAEFSLRWRAPRDWEGWLGYAWSEATDVVSGVSVPRTWNQLHSAAGGVSWSAEPWQLSATATWHSGWRSTPVASAPAVGGAAGADPVIELGARNSRAWDPFFSLDLRATWRRALPVGRLRLYAELNNLTDHGSPCCLALSIARPPAGAPRLQSEQRNWLPRYALFGVAWELP
jgi:outer membrane receptor protein involved in Fe transport